MKLLNLLRWLLAKPLVLSVVTTLVGFLGGHLFRRLLERRSAIRYRVSVWPMAQTVDDARFGAVQVTHRGQPAKYVYRAWVQFENVSSRDLENVRFHFTTTGDALFVSDAQVLGASGTFTWAPPFEAIVNRASKASENGGKPSDEDLHLIGANRDIIIPLIQRHDKFSVDYSMKNESGVTPTVEVMPSQTKGVVFRKQKDFGGGELLGVNRGLAGLVGFLPCLLIILVQWQLTQNARLGPLLVAATIGSFAELIGIALVHVGRQLKKLL